MLGAGSVRIERLNMSYLHISRLSRSRLLAPLAYWGMKSGSVRMQKGAPNNANDLPRCSPDEVPHVHLPVTGTAPVGVKAVKGLGHTEDAFMQARTVSMPCVHPLLATPVVEQGSPVSIQDL